MSGLHRMKWISVIDVLLWCIVRDNILQVFLNTNFLHMEYEANRTRTRA